MLKRLTIFLILFVVIIYISYFLGRQTTTPILPETTSLNTIVKNKIPKSAFSIGWVGDIVPTEDYTYNELALVGTSPFLQQPDLMIGNLEGTFALENRLSKCSYILSRCFAFRGDKNFAYNLKNSGFDVVSLVNNHAYDYGDAGLKDTETVLIEANIPYISATKPTLEIEIKNKKIGILGVTSTASGPSTITNYAFIKNNISKLKERNDIVILIFHGGAEGSGKTVVTGKYEYLGTENRGNVEFVAYTAIDAGADIILGSGPHVLRKVEYYNGKPIVYSAGNFVGGNGKLNTSSLLGVSGIFNIVEDSGIFSHNVIPIMLSKTGIPYFDPLGQANTLLESLRD